MVPHFTRSFNDWEMEEVENFYKLFCLAKFIPYLEDNLIWKEIRACNYSVKLCMSV